MRSRKQKYKDTKRMVAFVVSSLQFTILLAASLILADNQARLILTTASAACDYSLMSLPLRIGYALTS